MLNALNYLLKLRANGNSGAKEAFYFWIFLLNKREMALKVVIFSWLFYSIFRWGYILNETLWLALSVLKFIAIYLQCLSFEKTAQDQQWGTTNNGITPCKGHTTCNFHKQKSTISRCVYANDLCDQTALNNIFWMKQNVSRMKSLLLDELPPKTRTITKETFPDDAWTKIYFTYDYSRKLFGFLDRDVRTLFTLALFLN